MCVIDVGKVIAVSDVQPLKASRSMLVILLFNVIEVSELQPVNAW